MPTTVYCPRCGASVYFRFDTTYPPQPGRRDPGKFERNGYWYNDSELMCGTCRREFWLSKAQFS
jgi:hypothetical protein